MLEQEVLIEWRWNGRKWRTLRHRNRSAERVRLHWREQVVLEISIRAVGVEDVEGAGDDVTFDGGQTGCCQTLPQVVLGHLAGVELLN